MKVEYRPLTQTVGLKYKVTVPKVYQGSKSFCCGETMMDAENIKYIWAPPSTVIVYPLLRYSSMIVAAWKFSSFASSNNGDLGNSCGSVWVSVQFLKG